MEPLEDIDAARKCVLQEIRSLTSDVADIVAPDVKTLDDGIRMLASLREKAYELTNQLQHEALILEVAADIAKERGDRCIEWSWNPRQRGKSDEPDLRGHVNGDIVISAEVTTSQKPDGGIDRRMRDTLQKMSGFPGKRVYCVRTPEMRRRVQTKRGKAGYDIEVLMLPGRTKE